MKINLLARGYLWPRNFVLLGGLIIFFGPILVPTNACGQAVVSNSAPPAGPLLNSAPDFSQWVVTISYADERTQKPTDALAGPRPPAYLKLRPRTITTTKTKNIVHESIIAIDGPLQDKWYVGKIQYWKIAGRTDWYVNQLDTFGNSYTPPTASGFRDLVWVTEDTYVGIQSYAGRQCLVFKSNNNFDKVGQALVAYIDLQTRWPVEVQISGEVRTYHFETPPSDMQTLPDDLIQQIERGKRIRALLDLRAPTAPP